MKYMIIGAGGTGGILGYKLTEGGKDVTLIARGDHLKAMQARGLTIHRLWDGETKTLPLKAVSAEEYEDRPDVILVCVKDYSLDSVYPLIRKVAKSDTVVIPILNIYGTGGRMQEKLQDILVTDGCIYVSANKEAPGVLSQHGAICRVVFGVRDRKEYRPVLEDIACDLNESGISCTLSDNIQRDALQKFSYVSPIGAVGLYYDCSAGAIQEEGEPRTLFQAMIREIVALAEAMDIHFEQDLVKVNLNILSDLAPEATTSMQRDVMDGKSSEIDGLIYRVVGLGQKYKVPMPQYEKVAAELSHRHANSGKQMNLDIKIP